MTSENSSTSVPAPAASRAAKRTLRETMKDTWWSPQNQERFASSLASFLIHAFAFLVVALFLTFRGQRLPEPRELILTIHEQIPLSGAEDADPDATAAGGTGPLLARDVPIPVKIESRSPVAWQTIETPRLDADVASGGLVPAVDWTAPSGTVIGGGLEGRRAGRKGGLLKDRGGTDGSEAAVEKGLRWLAVHQRNDGSWSFNHQDGPCRGHCRNPGDFSSITASTALALLPFYGAGYTHQNGEHQDVVNRGLVFLGNRMLVTPHGGDLQHGSMYGQGLAAIVLCEAYAMTQDEDLRQFAQSAVDFIVYAQHHGGGWRYLPGQPGDTTVTGWQLMALKSAKMAGLNVSSEAIYRVSHFLDSVAADRGAKYGYQDGEPRSTTTAIGLYSRMLTGWSRHHPSLTRGIQYLDRQGPSANDMYFNYYATQVMHHYDGPSWPRWNQKMRDRLITEQATRGHESGSWYYEHEHSGAGGRLYSTCMAIMTLEVYYRYLPLYGRQAVDDF